MARARLWLAGVGALALGCAGIEAGVPPSWELPPPPPREAPVVTPGALESDDLGNGVRVLVLEDHRLPVVTLGVAVPRGAGGVPSDRAGLASFTAEVMKRGAGDRDALALAEAVEAIGASLSVSADWDSMSVTVSGLSRDLDRLLEVLADVVLRPRFEEAESTRARAEKLAGLEKAKDDPSTLVRWHALRALYPEHRFGTPIEGRPDSVAGLDAAAARAFHGDVFVPKEAIFFAVGHVDARELSSRAGTLFGEAAWSGGELVAQTPAPPAQVPQARKIVVVDRPDLGQARIVVTHEGIARTAEDRLATDLMNKVLGGSGFASRLMQTVRADAGLTYGVWSGYSLRRQPGPFQVATFTRAPETRRVVDLLLSEMERIRESPPDEQELAQATSLAVGRFGLSLESPAAVLASIVDLEIYDLPRDSLDTYRSRVRAVDGAATAAAARRHVHPERAAIVVLGPANVVAPLLEDLGEIEIVEP